MEFLNKALKSVRAVAKLDNDKLILYSSYVVFALSALFMIFKGRATTIALSLGVALMLYPVTHGNLAVALYAGALAGLVTLNYSRHIQHFANEDDEDKIEAFENKDEEEEGFEDEEKEEKEGFEAPKKAKKTKKGKAPPPDNGDRAEMFELGKKYKLPSEKDDEEYHLDAGTTFLNAYKTLKPDQIASMTKDTQDLMTTQKQLMSTLQTLKPLIKDGKDMMDMFQGYFGSGTPTMN